MMQHVVGPLPTAQAPAPDRRAAPPDAEDPTTALHGAMPRDAIVTGAVDRAPARRDRAGARSTHECRA